MSYVGQRLKRREDERFLLGRGAYVADVRRPDTLHLAVVRSPHAHARIRAIDVAAARACPGVVDVVTFDDVPELARVIPMRLAERGVLVKDTQGSTLRFAPPLVITAEEIDWATGQFADVLAESRSHLSDT